jgi:hypothetical protein
MKYFQARYMLTQVVGQVMAQWRGGRSNYIVRSVMERHDLQETAPGIVEAYLRIYITRIASHITPLVVFEVQPDDKVMGDVLLGSDLRRMVTAIDQSVTTSQNGEGTFSPVTEAEFLCLRSMLTSKKLRAPVPQHPRCTRPIVSLTLAAYGQMTTASLVVRWPL